MYPYRVLITHLLVALLMSGGWALTCLPCSEAPPCPELQCPGGNVLGPCGCCYECAKQLKEYCGDWFGTCDEGLECVMGSTDVPGAGVCEATPLFNRVTRPEERVAVVGLRVKIQATRSLADSVIEMVIQELRYEMIRAGLPEDISIHVRRIQEVLNEKHKIQP